MIGSFECYSIDFVSESDFDAPARSHVFLVGCSTGRKSHSFFFHFAFFPILYPTSRQSPLFCLADDSLSPLFRRPPPEPDRRDFINQADGQGASRTLPRPSSLQSHFFSDREGVRERGKENTALSPASPPPSMTSTAIYFIPFPLGSKPEP